MSRALIDYRGALEAVERIVDRGGDADEVLRAILDALHERGVSFAAVRFVEGGTIVDGPSVGRPIEGIEAAVAYDGARVGSLVLSVENEAFVRRVATLISPYVLVGWDTGGEGWSP